MSYDQLLKHRSRGCYGTFLVTWCTARRRPILAVAAHAERVAAVLSDSEQLGQCHNHAYVVMPDHVHWLLALRGRYPISTVVASAKARASRCLRAAVAVPEDGIWQTGFHEHALREEEDLIACARYVVANPLRAGLVERLSDYPHWFAEWAPVRGRRGAALG